MKTYLRENRAPRSTVRKADRFAAATLKERQRIGRVHVLFGHRPAELTKSTKGRAEG